MKELIYYYFYLFTMFIQNIRPWIPPITLKLKIYFADSSRVRFYKKIMRMSSTESEKLCIFLLHVRRVSFTLSGIEPNQKTIQANGPCVQFLEGWIQPLRHVIITIHNITDSVEDLSDSSDLPKLELLKV